MGIEKTAAPVLLVAAICYCHNEEAEQAFQLMAANKSPIREKSEPFSFTHTNYYQNEMGDNLQKIFCAFSETIDPMQIVDFKLYTNELEKKFSHQGQRRINIDPGYLEAAKLILATTKNFSHRIYLGKGIYGDVQLFWRNGQFQFNPWTYPDYKEPANMEFFTHLRHLYMNKGADLCQSPTRHLA